VQLERGFFFMVLKNIGDEPAVKVITKIGGKIVGPDGRKEINGLNVFRGVEFFAPGKEFRILMGSAVTYFSTKQPTQVHRRHHVFRPERQGLQTRALPTT